MKCQFALILLFCLTFEAQAQIFHIQRKAGSSTGNATLDAAIDAEIQDVENSVNKDIPSGNPSRLMKGMANSQAASGKGVATDYISHFDMFMLGAGVGLGADLQKNKQYDSDLSGAGLMGAAQMGINLSAFTDNTFLGMNPRKATLVVNGFRFGTDRHMSGNTIKATLTSVGFMGSYRWIEGDGNRWFGWDGIRVHTGYQFSSTKLKLTTNINESINDTTAGATTTGTITGTPVANIDSVTQSVPLEISTGVNFLYLLSFYGGLGTDFNMGYAKGKANANTQDSTITCTGGACGGGTSIIVESYANVNTKEHVMPFFLRGFAGFQFNLPYFNIYVTGNKIFGTEVYSVATGARLTF